MSDDGQYFVNKKAGRLYVSPRFGRGDAMRFIGEIVEGDADAQFAVVADELVIRRMPTKKFEIRATVTEHDRELKTLTFQKWNVEKGHAYERTYFTFNRDEIPRILEFVERVKSVAIASSASKVVPHSAFSQTALAPELAKRAMSENKDLVIAAATHDITTQDIVALGYRKVQLARFERLLKDREHFDEESERLRSAPEAVWQAFFEANQWIFGHGLSLVSMSGLDERKLEQTVKGADLSGPGKRADGVMKTNARLNAICFVEVKRHDSDLLKPKPYRPGAWPPSEELAGGVAQCHETVRQATEWMRGRYRPNKPGSGIPTGEDLFAVEPRSFLIIGSLLEFETPTGPDEARYRSFEMFRRNLHRPEVITFDELLFRARFIVERQEDEVNGTDQTVDEDPDEIPF